MNTISKNSRFKQTTRRRRFDRHGLTMFEVIVSALVLMTVMTFITSICLQTSLIWKDIGHQRAATHELSNQLDRLTRLTPDQAKQALVSLQPTAVCQRNLDNPKIEGQLVEDELGIRIELQLNWKRRNPGKPVQLSGWLVLPGNLSQETDQ